MLELREDFRAAWPDPFAAVQAQRGEVYRDKEGRTTLRFEFNGAGYFLKVHRGIGWQEIVKNLLQLRLPVLGAEQEWLAINRLELLGVPTLKAVGFGKRGSNPARQLSFLVTEELSDMLSLEDYCAPWLHTPPSYADKKALIEQLAKTAGTLHRNGVNHRDFYLCHFLMPTEGAPIGQRPLHVIDLHRAQLRAAVPRRWLLKDMAALYFSAADIGLSKRDVLRFLRAYAGLPLRQVLADTGFWLQVKKRAEQLYLRDEGRLPQLPL